MKKTAFNIKPIAKKIGIATGIAGLGTGAGIVGHAIGSSNTSERLTNAFMDANNRENQAIANDFRIMNEKENQVIANKALNQGVQYGYQMALDEMNSQTKKASEENTMDEQYLEKIAESIYGDAFVDELQSMGLNDEEVEKVAASFPAGLAGKILGVAGSADDALRSVGSAIKNKGKILGYDLNSALSNVKSIPESMKEYGKSKKWAKRYFKNDADSLKSHLGGLNKSQLNDTMNRLKDAGGALGRSAANPLVYGPGLAGAAGAGALLLGKALKSKAAQQASRKTLKGILRGAGSDVMTAARNNPGLAAGIGGGALGLGAGGAYLAARD